MRTLTFVLLFLATSWLSAKSQPINPIIGDQSFIMKFGEAPNDQTNDQVRIAAHLQYAEYLLCTADVSAMPFAQREKRKHLLDLLHDYWTRGIFPHNDDYTGERRPCFIDHNGTICAVGYLVEKTAGRDVAELISERFLYEEILDMNDPLVMEWIASCGLTAEELAIIQPSYRSRTEFMLGASYGASFRLRDNVYHSFGIYRMKYEDGRNNRRRKYSANASGGIRFDFLNNGNFSAGLRYSQAVSLGRYGRYLGHLAIMPECFRYNKTWGMNIKPEYEIGRSWESFDFCLAYSYAIPVVSESAYGAGRHDVTLRVMLNLDDFRIKIPKRKKPQDPPPGV